MCMHACVIGLGSRRYGSRLRRMDKSATELAQNRCDAQPSSAAGCLLFEGQRLTRRTTASSAFAVAWRPPRQLLGLDRSTSRGMGPFPAGAPRALRTTIVTTLARTQWRNISDMSDPTELSTAVNRQLEGFTRAADDRRSAEAQHHRNYESCLAILDQLLVECATMLNAAGVRFSSREEGVKPGHIQRYHGAPHGAPERRQRLRLLPIPGWRLSSAGAWCGSWMEANGAGPVQALPATDLAPSTFLSEHLRRSTACVSAPMASLSATARSATPSGRSRSPTVWRAISRR